MKKMTIERKKEVLASDIGRTRILEKLNNGGFKRTPLKNIQKHKIVYDKVLKKYV